jgi:CRISPR-associated Csx14 family protein
MANVLIASLGESPAVVSTMYDLLTRSKKFQIDHIEVFCPRIDKVELSYSLVEDAFKSQVQKKLLTLTPLQLDFADANTRERSIKFLSKLYHTLDEHQNKGDTVYLSLAGGRKSMAALMAWVVPFFTCIKGLYHVIDPNEEHFFTTEQLILGVNEVERHNYMHPEDLTNLRLVEIPYTTQQNINEDLRQDLLTVDIDYVPEEKIEAYQTFREVVSSDKRKGLRVQLTQSALEQFEEFNRKDALRARKFKACLEKMRSPQLLYDARHDWVNRAKNTYKHFHYFKRPRTAERPVFYTKPVDVLPNTLDKIEDVIVCGLEYEKGEKYRPIQEIVDSPQFAAEPVIDIDKLPAIQRDAPDTLIVALGKRPMIVTQLYTLLKEKEKRYIDEIVLVYPAENETIKTSFKLIQKAFKSETNNKVKVTAVELKNIADIDSTDASKLYQEELEKAIEQVQQKNSKGEVLLSLSGGRKGMTAQTIFAAQNKNIHYVYHTLITDEKLAETIEKKTAIDKLQREVNSNKERDNRLFLRDYDKAKFTLFRVPVFNNKMLHALEER